MRQPTWLYLETVDSTNKYLKEHAGELPDFTACYSLNQTAGAGRRGRDWSSQRDTMLALSFLLHGTQLQDMQVLPLLCAIFYVEDLSVMMQVAYFKYTRRRTGTGRRIFKMTPLHHHFQKPGNAGIDAIVQKPLQAVPESKIVTRFWIVCIFLAAITFVTLKIR